MVYQEQVMQIAQVIGGYSLGGADLLRRAMGKKNAEEMAKQRDIFVAGAAKNGVAEKKAERTLRPDGEVRRLRLQQVARRGLCAGRLPDRLAQGAPSGGIHGGQLVGVMDDTDKVQGSTPTPRQRPQVLPPDVNQRRLPLRAGGREEHALWPGRDKGHGRVGDRGHRAAREQGGPFRDLFDFCERIDKRVVNRRVIEALVRAGAFDCINRDRAGLFASVGIALEAAEQRERNAQQVSLFGDAGGAGAERPALIRAECWDEGRVLKEEKASLGFYLSGHPFSAYRAEVQRFVRGTLKGLQPGTSFEQQQKGQLIAGVVESVRIQRTQSGRMVILNLSDGSAAQEVTIYSEVYDQYRELCKEDKLLVIEAKVKLVRRAAAGEEGDASFMRIIADKIYDLAAARSQFARAIRLSINGEASSDGAAAAAPSGTCSHPTARAAAR